MLNWLTRQRRQLHGFYRDGFGRALGMTVLAFAAVMVVSYAVTMANAAPIERLMNLFRELHGCSGICLNPSLHTVISLFFHIHMVQSVAGIRHCGSSKQTQGGCGGCLHFVPFSFLHGYHFGVLQLSADFFLYHLMNKIGSFRDIVFHLF